jgi:energy-coupling factor transporter ATP-binding protein EcfA2
LNPEGVAHVTLVPADTGEDHREIHVVLDSAIYRSELSALYADAQPGKVLSKEQCTLAMGLLAHRARKVDKQKLYCRSALRDGALYIDRGTPDGQCIKVSAAEISTITNPPIPFLYRGEKYAALPLPEFGGSVQDFARHFNVNKEDLITLIAFILVALFGAEAYPILLIQGLQGSGKSTLMDMVRALIDPTVNRKDGRATFCNKEHDLFIAASSRQVLCFDNISIVDQAASDALCRMSTGGSLSTRKYYSDSDEKAFTACRPVMATAIGSPTKRGDFLDRCVMVTAQHLDKRRTERRIWDDFERDRPKLFGFLLTALQMAMQNLDRIEAEMDEGKYSKHRMAELTALVEAAASMLGLERGEFSARQDKAQQLMQAESAMGDSFILAIHDHLSRHPAIDVLELTARELLNKIQPDYPPKGWPHTNQVKRIFQRNGAGLAAIGLQVDFVNPEGHANIFRYRITRTELFQASDVNTIPIKLPF